MSTKIHFFLMVIEQGHISEPFSWVEPHNRIQVNRMRIEVIFTTSRSGLWTVPVALLCLPAPTSVHTQREQPENQRS